MLFLPVTRRAVRRRLRRRFDSIARRHARPVLARRAVRRRRSADVRAPRDGHRSKAMPPTRVTLDVPGADARAAEGLGRRQARQHRSPSDRAAGSRRAPEGVRVLPSRTRRDAAMRAPVSAAGRSRSGQLAGQARERRADLDARKKVPTGARADHAIEAERAGSRCLAAARAASAAARRRRSPCGAAPMPRCSRIAAASAIIAPLSVHSASSGKCTRTPRCAHAALEPLAQLRVRADAAGDDEPVEPGLRRAPPSTCVTSTSTIACLRRRREVRARRCSQTSLPSFARLRAHGRLQAGEREVERRAVQQRPRQRERLGIAEVGQPRQRRAAGIAEAEQLGRLVEGLAGGVVDGLAEQRVAADVVDAHQLRVAARDEQRDERKRAADRPTRNGDSRWPSRWCTPSTGRSERRARARRRRRRRRAARRRAPGPRV